MKRTFLLVMMTVIAVASFAAHSYSFASGGVYYNITSSTNMTVEVTYGSAYNSYSGVVTIPKMVSYNGVNYTVTKSEAMLSPVVRT